MATDQREVNVGVAATRISPGDIGSYMDWAAVIAGSVLASAISLVLLTFGAAIGLSMTSPFEGEGASGPLFVIALGLWLLWVIVSSFMAGGYLAGRMRPRVGDATKQEVEARDGAHGLTVWALGILVAALLTAGGISGVLRGGSQVAGSVAAAAGEDGGTDPFDYAVDIMFRSTTGDTVSPEETNSAKREVIHILTRAAAKGELSGDDRAYVRRLVAQRTGLAPADVDQRVDEVLATAKQAAETARKAGVLLGFLTAAALLAGAAAAWWGASTGGRHRDEETDFGRMLRWR